MTQTELYEIFGANVRAARELAGLTRRDLAERAQLPQLQLRRIEAGGRLHNAGFGATSCRCYPHPTFGSAAVWTAI